MKIKKKIKRIRNTLTAMNYLLDEIEESSKDGDFDFNDGLQEGVDNLDNARDYLNIKISELQHLVRFRRPEDFWFYNCYCDEEEDQ